MNDTTQAVENTQNTQVDTVEPTLDDLYKESGLEASTTQTHAAPQEVTSPANQAEERVEVPDAFDVDRHREFLANLESKVRKTEQTQAEINNRIRAEQQQAFVARLEEDIKQASSHIAKESGIENENLATFELNERARTDVKFKALWEGRNSSPQAKAAFTKALNVIAKDIGKKYEVRADPQLVANRKALAASRNASATTTQDDSNEPDWGSKNGAEFQANWERMVRGHN